MFSGGVERNLTLGVNWYPGRSLRVALNYINGGVDSAASGRFNILQARFLFAF